ncbi:hypothetical protein FB562_2547 [Homoserinimonas aerilata]|uniref:Uncharacterized protein n=1 Tax=Homoserinimonas aerilata TaxID=1162970 RepID=A0A542Y1L6_9MICO|nr:hypothetical protein [Homoserinimonas aerilata]TQL41960.1 hypothetical protein FB562_2547 [Homoserinimonas aerilata]
MAVGPWAIIIVALLALSVALLVLLVRISRRGIAEGTPAGRDSLILFAITYWGAIAYAALMTIVGVITIVTALSGDVTLDVPVSEFWPELDPRFTVLDQPDATIVGGGFTTATLTLAGLDLPTRLLLGLQAALSSGMFVTISLAIARIAKAVEGRRPFTSVLPKATTAAAIAVGIGGFGAQIAGGIASSMASEQALGIHGWSAEGVTDAESLELGLPEPTLLVQFDFWPLLLFIVLSALAAIFAYAERLQRDTERLERDTEGLV